MWHLIPRFAPALTDQDADKHLSDRRARAWRGMGDWDGACELSSVSYLCLLFQGCSQGVDPPFDVPQPGLGLLLQALALGAALPLGTPPHRLQPQALVLELGYQLPGPPSAHRPQIIPRNTPLPTGGPGLLGPGPSGV